MNLRPFQRRFLKSALAPGIRTAALSLPRGNGKSTLVAWLGARTLDPDDSLFVSGSESHIVAASIGQARRSTFKLLREFIEASPRAMEYRISESSFQCAVNHAPTNTRISVLASSGKTSQGLVRCPWLFADEPGSWETTGGQLLHEAIQTAQGKPGTNLRAIYLGTLAPATSGWWHELIGSGSTGSTHVTSLVGDLQKWDQAAELRRANPLKWAFPETRKILLEEHDKAKANTRLKAAFLSFYLNLPALDEEVSLLTPDEWERVLARSVPGRDGLPIVGVDIGGGRAWSAAVGMWESGRVEALALAPGEPDISAQEKRDSVPTGTYRRMVESGALIVAEGRRVPPVTLLVEAIAERWGGTAGIVCDRFRLAELEDAAEWPIDPRVAQWSNSTEDIRGLRRQALDGDIGVAQGSRELLTWSLSVARVKHDDSGNSKLVKGDNNNRSRDDVAQAFLLAGGALDRERRRPKADVSIMFG